MRTCIGHRLVVAIGQSRARLRTAPYRRWHLRHGNVDLVGAGVPRCSFEAPRCGCSFICSSEEVDTGQAGLRTPIVFRSHASQPWATAALGLHTRQRRQRRAAGDRKRQIRRGVCGSNPSISSSLRANHAGTADCIDRAPHAPNLFNPFLEVLVPLLTAVQRQVLLLGALHTGPGRLSSGIVSQPPSGSCSASQPD